MRCRFCNRELKEKFLSLGLTPLSNSYLKKEQLLEKETCFPLEVYVCEQCFLVQAEEFESPENIFSDYAYFSSYSDSWLEHCQAYVEEICKRLDLNSASQVIEIASNDGYLLQYFIKKGIPALGIEPAQNVARVANENGIPTEVFFFGTDTARAFAAQGKTADLLIGNNVLAHVPDINDFVAGLAIVLKPSGVITLEFPHLMCLIDGLQFDTIYHEHFSYFSFLTVECIMAAHQLVIYDVEEIPTHGGSLRIYIKHAADLSRSISVRVEELREKEIEAGYLEMKSYQNFKKQVSLHKKNILDFLIQAKTEEKSIAAYGAPAKGNTLLNYCGIGTDFIAFTVDKNPNKQSFFLPGSHIPIYEPEQIKIQKPDYIIILPWNLQAEIVSQLQYAREWNASFVTLIPDIKVF